MTIQEMKKISEFVQLSEKMTKSYFWNPPYSASRRRSYENQNSFTEATISFAGDEFRFSATCTCSCKNIYFKKEIFKNGKKTNLTSLKNVLKKANALLFV